MTDTAESASAPPDAQPENRRIVKSVLVTGITCVVLGLLTGLVWLWLAPRPQIRIEGESAYYVDIAQAGIGMDMTFGVLGFVAGILTAAIALAVCRSAGIELAVLAGVFGFVGSYLAMRLGMAIVGGLDAEGDIDVTGKADGEVFLGPLQIHANGVLAIWSFVAVVVITVGFAVKAQRTLKTIRRDYSDELAEQEEAAAVSE